MQYMFLLGANMRGLLNIYTLKDRFFCTSPGISWPSVATFKGFFQTIEIVLLILGESAWSQAASLVHGKPPRHNSLLATVRLDSSLQIQ